MLRGGYVKPFLYIFSFCFIRYEVGMLNPFYLVLVLFVLYVTRWVCETLLIYFFVCFICYGVGMLNPLYSF